MMKARMMFAGLAATLMLTGCSTMEMPTINNPFEQPSITETYVSQFRDVPIPAPMASIASESLVTVAVDGSKFGLEAFSGRVDGQSLATVMMKNMASAGWQIRGSSAGVRSVQLYEKAPHYAVLFFREGLLKTSMDVWVINGINTDMLNLIPEAHGFSSAPTYGGASSYGGAPAVPSYGASSYNSGVTQLSN